MNQHNVEADGRLSEMHRRHQSEIQQTREEMNHLRSTIQQLSVKTEGDIDRPLNPSPSMPSYGDARNRRPSLPAMMYQAPAESPQMPTCDPGNSPVRQAATNHVAPVSNVSTVICATVSKPPLFRQDHYGEYRKSLSWWLKLQSGIGEDRLIASICMCAEGAAKWVLNGYITTTDSNRSGRTVAGYMKMMGGRFRKSGGDLLLNKLCRWNDFKRQKNEELGVYWIRFGRIVGQLQAMGMTWPGQLLFPNAYQSLDLSRDHRTVLTDALEMAGKHQCVNELRRLSIKILGFKDEKHTGDLFRAENQSEDDTNTYDEDDGQAAALQKHRVVKSKTTPGNLDRAAQSTNAFYGMSGEGRCLRCGSADHWWGNCPHPFDRAIISPKTKGMSKPSTGEGGKGKSSGGGEG